MKNRCDVRWFVARTAMCSALALLCSVADLEAGEFWRHKWLDFPDPVTAPKATAECVKEAIFDAPCPTFRSPLRTCEKRQCVGHRYKFELLRVDVVFVATGPDTAEDAVRKAVEGYVAGCGAAALTAAWAAYAATHSPEPFARAGAGTAAAITSFKGCLASATLAGLAGSIVKQVELKVENPTHWAPL